MPLSNENQLVIGGEAPLMMTILEEIAATHDLCSKALESSDVDAFVGLRNLPTSAKGWFTLLSGIPEDPKRVRQLQLLQAEAAQIAGYVAGTLERFGILQVLVEVCPKLTILPVHPSVHLEFCATARRVADHSQGWPTNFHYDSDAFEELCRIVTLRRYHAGQLSFDIMSMPRTWLLKVHPLVLPKVIGELVGRMGGIRPIAMPHLNYWRRNPILMTPNENERSLWRMAKTIELQPDVKGFVASSWFYCASVGKISPHLAWVRDFFQDHGAFLADMDPAPIRSGFLIGSQRRRQLYTEGKFRPRQTLVLWPRDEMLRWAASYPYVPMDQASVPEKQLSINASPRLPISDSRSIIVHATSSGRFTLLNCEPVLNFTPRRYVLAVFVIPWILLVVLATVAFGFGGTVLAAVLVPIVIWLIQYLFLQ